MKRRVLVLLLPVVLLLSTFSPGVPAARVPFVDAPAAVVPFELIKRHIFLKINVNSGDPLWFILDTGDKYALIDLDRAKAKGLNLQGQINVGGVGAGSLRGAYVKDAAFTVAGLEGFSQPLSLALPLGAMAPQFGHDIDGILGADFIKQFVVEIDYAKRVLRLHDKQRFTYSGPGEAIPAHLNPNGHPIIKAEVTVQGEPIKAEFVVDLGSGGSLVLHSPFVNEHHLLGPDRTTIRAIGGGGAGGETFGRLGRISGLKIGSFTIDSPMTRFSTDTHGAFANSVIQGNIGQQIMSKFKVLLDYERERIILEPNATYKEPIGNASSGLNIVAEGKDYKTFRVKDVLENSPGTDAGLLKDDVIVAINDRPAAALTLSSIVDQFEVSAQYKLLVRRGEQTIRVTITPRRLV